MSTKLDIAKIKFLTKQHLARHKATYIVGTVAVLAMMLQQYNVKAFTKFLEEKGIDPLEYFCPEELEEQRQS